MRRGLSDISLLFQQSLGFGPKQVLLYGIRPLSMVSMVGSIIISSVPLLLLFLDEVGRDSDTAGKHERVFGLVFGLDKLLKRGECEHQCRPSRLKVPKL